MVARVSFTAEEDAVIRQHPELSERDMAKLLLAAGFPMRRRATVGMRRMRLGLTRTQTRKSFGDEAFKIAMLRAHQSGAETIRIGVCKQPQTRQPMLMGGDSFAAFQRCSNILG